MHIFSSSGSDPMLLDSAQGLRALHEALGAFLASRSFNVAFEAATSGSPAPYDKFLLGLRVSKGSVAQLQVSAAGWLELSASPEELQGFRERFLVSADGEHRHWYSAPVSLIIEADNSWSEASAG
jgi:hypothetical protein